MISIKFCLIFSFLFSSTITLASNNIQDWQVSLRRAQSLFASYYVQQHTSLVENLVYNKTSNAFTGRQLLQGIHYFQFKNLNFYF